MTIRLDPFQMIRGIPPSEVTVEGVTTIRVPAFPSLNSLTLCSGGSDLVSSYRMAEVVALSAPFLNCGQGEITLRGQTSGFSVYVGFDQLGDPISNCENQGCYQKSLDPDYYHQFFLSWNETLKNYRGAFTYHSIDPPSFINNELVDMIFPGPPSTSVEAITQRSANEININSPGHSMPDGAWITLSGTENYDGEYETNHLDADNLWVTQNYVSDEESGSVKPNYQH